MISGLKIAIFGLGRSGLAIGRASLALGAHPSVFDQNSVLDLPKRDAYDEALADGIPVVLDWNGSLPYGFDLLVVNPAVPKVHPFLMDALHAGVQVISEIEFAFRISKAPIVAITGTNGKSTTTVMTYLCLKECGENPILCGNIFGSGYPEMPMTEAALMATKDQVLVAEVSSFHLEWVVDFEPVAAGITNIWPDHLTRYPGGFAEYSATKHRIFACQTNRDFAVVKANDPEVVPPGGAGTSYRPRHRRSGSPSDLVKPTTYPTVLTFGSTGKHAHVDDLELTVLNQRIRLDELPFSEPHNYQNAGMAALLAYSFLRWKAANDPTSLAASLVEAAKSELPSTISRPKGLPEPEKLALPISILQGLRQFHGLAHRMEKVGDRDGVTVINNSMCTNPDAVIKSVMAVRDPVHILIGGVNKGLDFGPLRHYLANHRHRAYLYGSDSEQLSKMIGETYPIFRTMDAAFAAATREAVGGEVIMLAPGCASTDQFRDFRDRGDVFRIIAKEWLSQ